MAFEFVTAFSLGVLSTSNPCAIPLYPGFLAYLTRRSNANLSPPLLGLFVVLGVLSSMLAVGMAAGILRSSLGGTLTVATPVRASILALFGLLLILDVNPWKHLRGFRPPSLSNPFLQAYAYGTLYGPISLPCIAPLIFSVVTFSVTLTETISNLLFFSIFGFGLALPLFIIAVVSDGLKSTIIGAMVKHHRKFMVFAGILLLIVAAYSYVNLYIYGRYFV